jgi:pilus assembly protein Flp/PilA
MSQFVALLNLLVARRNDDGATAVEYGLMVALIAGVILAAVTLLGQDINTAFGNVEAAIAAAL